MSTYISLHTYSKITNRRSEGGMEAGMIDLRRWTIDDKYQQGSPPHTLVTVVCPNTRLRYACNATHACSLGPHHNKKHTHTSLVPRHVCQESAHTNETSRPNTEASSPVWFHSYAVTRRTHARPRWNVFSAAAASADVSFESRPPLEGRSAGAPQPLSSKLTPPMNYKTNRNNPCIKSRLYAAPSGETEQTVAVSAYTQSSCWGLRPI